MTPEVLVARGPDRAAGLLDRLREAGIETVAAPVIERAPVEDPAEVAELAVARAALSRGEYAWVVVTSVNAVDTMLGSRRAAPPGTRWACVGPATRRAIEAHGLTVELVPEGRLTAAGLAAAFPDAPAPGGREIPARPGEDVTGLPDAPRPSVRVLLPLGDLAGPALADGLRAKGWEPHVVVAYRTVARELPPDVVARATTRGYDAVVVASGSAARQVAARLGPQRVVAIGDPSASAARDAGHDVVAVAVAPTDDALATAVAHALGLPEQHAPGDLPSPGGARPAQGTSA
ncbi:hypothetical protein GCM10028784_35600 [Myceligenerans cantabricum]